MIQEAYVSFEVAKLLKEKGMDKSCFKHYVQKNNNDGTSEAVTVCTLQMAMAWLREVHNICIIIEPHTYDCINKKNTSYVYSLWQGDNYYENPELKSYLSYEEAVEAALKYVLKNLI
jgi:Fe-S cluster assembly iron-binding protein IscA